MPLSEDRKAELARLVPPGLEGVRLAVNLHDLDRVDSIVRQTLLGGRMDLSQAVWVDRSKVDETAVVFTCPLLQAASVCDVLRSHDRQAGDFPTRVYLFRRAWTKLPAAAVLTKVVDGKCLISEEVFGYDGSPRLTVPAAAERLELGRSAVRRNGRNGRAEDQR